MIALSIPISNVLWPKEWVRQRLRSHQATHRQFPIPKRSSNSFWQHLAKDDHCFPSAKSGSTRTLHFRIPPRIIEPASTILSPFSHTEMDAEARRQHPFLLAFPKEPTFVTRWGTITCGGTREVDGKV